MPSDSLAQWIETTGEIPANGTHLVGLDTLGKALVVAEARRRSRRPLILVSASKAEARALMECVEFFLGPAFAEKTHYLGPIEFDYYRGLLANPESLCERNVALFHLVNNPEGRVFVTTAAALVQKVFPQEGFLRSTQTLAQEAEIDRDQLLRNLVEAGYQRQPSAYDPGVFAVRGGVLDIFCPLYKEPLRLEFFGDFIEEIRFFNPESQRSSEKIAQVDIIPVGQSLLPHSSSEDFAVAAAKVKQRLDAEEVPKTVREELLLKAAEAKVTPELGLLFPLFSKGSESLIGYFPNEACVFWPGKAQLLSAVAEQELPKYYKSYELYEKDKTPIAAREDLFCSLSEFTELFEATPGLYFDDFETSATEGVSVRLVCEPTHLEAERTGASGGQEQLLEAFARRFKSWMDRGYRIQVISHTKVHCDRVALLFEGYRIHSKHHGVASEPLAAMLETDFSVLNLWQGYLPSSQIFPELRLVLLSEEEIFGKKKRTGRSASWSNTSDPARLLSTFRDLKVGDYVVHRDHGVGRYQGLKSMQFEGVANDYVQLEYKDGDKLYIPVYRLNVLQKYQGGEGAQVSVDKLGGDRWVKAKSKAQRAIAEMAEEFLRVHAKRKMIPAVAFPESGTDYAQFEMEFPFDETPDQLKAIEEVMGDLGQPHPMDRLVCGDVGYGKTEVAMRAAFRAVAAGKQVAVLVPTTVLAFQHFHSFRNRFKSTAVRIEMVSRLRSSAEIKKTLEATKDGKVDILIGTHRLLSADIAFRDLALVVVDEEHRFGVVHKERLKKMTESIHVISMTATPIPRTLNMAMTGIKEVSIITTPPPDRLSVRTFVCRREPEVMIEAIQNELARGGQVFFLHNRVQSIQTVADDLKRWLPKVKIEVVHGQMDPETLEEKMLSFYKGEFDILLTTAIIESGIDIPKANTILIDDAQNLGLAQLYQLRGRVGRSDKRAYCYLLVPAENQMTEEGKQRLQVIQRYSDLGSGFNIASHDLEIRGAGDLLGKDQSGHLHAIGVDLYFELLEEAMRQLKGEAARSEIEPEINLRVPAFFPNDYLPDISERLTLYRRLSNVESEEAVSQIEAEIRDRFGTLPEEVANLMGIMMLKLHLKKLHVVRMSCGPKKTSLQFAATTPASPEKLVKLLQKNPELYSVTPDQKLVFTPAAADWKSQLREVQRLSLALGVS